MSNSREAAARHHPIAYGPATSRDAQARLRESQHDELRHTASESKMKAAVVEKRHEDAEPYSDVPCTD